MAFTEKDLDFADYILAPAATYVDTMVLRFGWARQDAETEFDLLRNSVVDVYGHFGGSEAGLPLPPDADSVESYVDERASKQVYGWSGREDMIAAVALKYLVGQGEDYQCMHDLL